MKKLSLVILLLVSLISPALIHAQDSSFNRHEVSVGLGAFSTSNLVLGFADMFVEGVSGSYGNKVTFSNSKASPVFHLAYKYTLGSRFGLGATIAAGTEHSDFEQSGNANVFTGKKNSFIGTLAGEASFNYVNSQNFKLYGLAGIGGTFINLERKYDNGDIKTDGKIIPDFQITPIGLKFGNNFGGFAELGFGYKGLVNIGFFARF